MTELFVTEHPLNKINYDELMKFVAHVPVTHDNVSLTDAKTMKGNDLPVAILTVSRRNDGFEQDEITRVQNALKTLGFEKSVLKWNKRTSALGKRYEFRLWLYV